MIVNLDFKILDTGAALTAMQNSGLAVQSVSSNIVLVDDGASESAVRLLAWRHSEQMVQLRAERDARLAECDWTQLPDAALTVAERANWQAYRQALRDLPQNYSRPEDVVAWPLEPGR